MSRLLVTGGAGFVGASLAIALAERHPDWELLALDNLHRRGSELNLPRLDRAGVEFIEGDVRDPAALDRLPPLDAILECSAEPSILAGRADTDYSLQTNLVGAYNCLELARRDGAAFIFLSTSRVYPVAALNSVSYIETDTRFELGEEQALPGVSPEGISEQFPLEGARTLYGATKLGAELLIAEYAEDFGLATVINRCGVIAGPWQMGRVDQGVFAWWVLCHELGRPLSYIGYGGKGKQVRDLLDVGDLTALVDEQLGTPERWAGTTVNVGGGVERSLSLQEATAICRQLTGREVEIDAEAEGRPGDVPIYVSDCARLFLISDWRPRRSVRETLVGIHEWVRQDPELLADALGVSAK
jgi:CDP-paratose 2-epimerase